MRCVAFELMGADESVTGARPPCPARFGTGYRLLTGPVRDGCRKSSDAGLKTSMNWCSEVTFPQIVLIASACMVPSVGSNGRSWEIRPLRFRCRQSGFLGLK